MLEDLVASQPDQPRYRAELGHASHILGYLLDEERDNARALEALLRARKEEEQAVHDAPEQDLYRINLCSTSSGTWGSNMWTWTGSPRACRSIADRSSCGVSSSPPARTTAHRILELADQLAMLANVERHGGDSASARRDYAEAAALLEPIDTAAVDAEVQVPRATYLIGEAMAAADQGQDAQALPLLRRAVEILTPFVASAREDIKPRQRLTEALWQQARLLRRDRRCRRG